jgi:Peptidase M50B-like
MMITDNRRDVAIHEAGHAVIARALGFEVREVLINSDDSGLTHCMRRREATHQYVLVLMAGPIAQHLANQGFKRDRKIEAVTWAQDLQHIRAHMAGLGNEAKPWRVYQAGARRLVRDRWPIIRRVAGELLRGGRIDGKRLDQIIAG